MSSDDTHINTSELLQRWLNGDATAADERALLKAARTDAFLADALSGYLDIPGALHDNRTQNIRQSLRVAAPAVAQEAVVKPLPKFRARQGGMPVWRYAAVAVVVLMAGLVIWWMLQQDTSVTLADSAHSKETTEESKAAETTTYAADDTMIDTLNTEEELLADAQVTADPVITPSAAVLPSAAPPPPVEATPSPAQPTLGQTSPADLAPQISGAKVRTEERETASRTEMAVGSEDAPADSKPHELPAERIYGGKVIDNVGNQLIGAKVTVSGSSQAVLTDQKGNFRIQVPQDKDQLSVTHLGYVPTSLELPPSGTDYLQIRMKIDEPHTMTTAKEAFENGVEVSPKGGYDRLARYITKNARYPKAAHNNDVAGTVELTFLVQPDGSLSEIRVRRGLGYGCDEEAIRLLSSGPKWRNPSKSPVRASYTVPCRQ